MKYISAVSPPVLKNKICILRLDFNTADDWRMAASLPTIAFLRRYCRAILVISHKGRPKGHAPALSLKKDAQKLSRLINARVSFLPHFEFSRIRATLRSAPPGSVYVLENLRFLKGEEANDPSLGRQLASLGDIYVNDAFAVSHRSNASVVAVTRHLPSYAGLELEAEIKHLSRAMRNPRKPLIMIIGGAKIKKKLRVYSHLKRKAELFLIGGLLTKEILKMKEPKLVFPIDTVKEGGIIQDIGPKTERLFIRHIRTAGTIIWNGPLGDIDKAKFTRGTRIIARAVVQNRRAFAIVGGGETIMFLKKLKLDSKIDFVSTGGGAMLEFLAGKKLPGIEALRR